MPNDRTPEAGLDIELAKALSHPLRQRLLGIYTRGPASPSQAAAMLGARLGDVAYHTRRLHDMGWLELVRTERGPGVKHFYEASFASLEIQDATWDALPERLRRGLADSALQQVATELRNAADAGALQSADVHVSRTALDLDEQAWTELSALLVELIQACQRLARESAGRTGPDATRRSSVLTLLHFPRG